MNDNRHTPRARLEIAIDFGCSHARISYRKVRFQCPKPPWSQLPVPDGLSLSGDPIPTCLSMTPNSYGDHDVSIGRTAWRDFKAFRGTTIFPYLKLLCVEDRQINSCDFIQQQSYIASTTGQTGPALIASFLEQALQRILQVGRDSEDIVVAISTSFAYSLHQSLDLSHELRALLELDTQQSSCLIKAVPEAQAVLLAVTSEVKIDDDRILIADLGHMDGNLVIAERAPNAKTFWRTTMSVDYFSLGSFSGIKDSLDLFTQLISESEEFSSLAIARRESSLHEWVCQFRHFLEDDVARRPDAEFKVPFGLPRKPFEAAIDRARQDLSLYTDRCTLTIFRVARNFNASRVIVTGGPVKAARLQKSLMHTSRQMSPSIALTIHQRQGLDTGSTVQKGLQLTLEDPGCLQPPTLPFSIYMLSDMSTTNPHELDATAEQDDRMELLHVANQPLDPAKLRGQSLTGISLLPVRQYDVKKSASEPMYFDCTIATTPFGQTDTQVCERRFTDRCTRGAPRSSLREFRQYKAPMACKSLTACVNVYMVIANCELLLRLVYREDGKKLENLEGKSLLEICTTCAFRNLRKEYQYDGTSRVFIDSWDVMRENPDLLNADDIANGPTLFWLE